MQRRKEQEENLIQNKRIQHANTARIKISYKGLAR